VKKHYLLRCELLKHFYYNKRVSLASLSKLTHKSVPLVTNAVSNLIEEGYVLENGLGPSTGGRRGLTFSLNNEKPRYMVAVAVDQLVTRIVIYDLLNNIKMPEEKQEIILEDTPGMIDRFALFLKDYISRSAIKPQQILGVGIGMPGFVNAEQGVNYTFFKTGKEEKLTDLLSEALGLPVFIDNDSSIIALAELKFGAGRNLKDVLVVNVGWGTGLGMIVNGDLFRGHSGYAGEFSHIPLSQSNKICSCGKRGCLEVDTSLLVMLERAKAEMQAGGSSSMEHIFRSTGDISGDQFLQAAKAGDPLAVAVLSEAAFLIGKGMATLIHIMNPKLIILSGRGAIAGKILMAPVQQAINEFCIPWLAEQTEIEVSQLALDSELLGAATLVVENCDFN
jgi:predicted NBD/HSP70 family sugar kinase